VGARSQSFIIPRLTLGRDDEDLGERLDLVGERSQVRRVDAVVVRAQDEGTRHGG
jgi:hypothetical protein